MSQIQSTDIKFLDETMPPTTTTSTCEANKPSIETNSLKKNREKPIGFEQFPQAVRNCYNCIVENESKLKKGLTLSIQSHKDFIDIQAGFLDWLVNSFRLVDLLYRDTSELRKALKDEKKRKEPPRAEPAIVISPNSPYTFFDGPPAQVLQGDLDSAIQNYRNEIWVREELGGIHLTVSFNHLKFMLKVLEYISMHRLLFRCEKIYNEFSLEDSWKQALVN